MGEASPSFSWRRCPRKARRAARRRGGSIGFIGSASHRKCGASSTWPQRARGKSCIYLPGRHTKLSAMEVLRFPIRGARCSRRPGRLSKTKSGSDSRSGRTSRKEAQITAIAASHANNLLVMPRPGRPAVVRRLPPDYRPPDSPFPALSNGDSDVAALAGSQLYRRHEGGVLSRSLGSAVHALLEELARLRATSDWPSARLALERMRPRITSQLRGGGRGSETGHKNRRPGAGHCHQRHARFECAMDSVAARGRGQRGALGRDHRRESARGSRRPHLPRRRCSRARKATIAGGSSITRPRTTIALIRRQALAKFRPLFASQLELYARVLRNLHGQDVAVRAGLYYPRMLAFDWWEL